MQNQTNAKLFFATFLFFIDYFRCISGNYFPNFSAESSLKYLYYFRTYLFG